MFFFFIFPFFFLPKFCVPFSRFLLFLICLSFNSFSKERTLYQVHFYFILFPFLFFPILQVKSKYKTWYICLQTWWTSASATTSGRRLRSTSDTWRRACRWPRWPFCRPYRAFSTVCSRNIYQNKALVDFKQGWIIFST